MNSRHVRLIDVAGSVSRETIEKLETLERMVASWTVATNLVGQSTVAEMWERHIVDSAQLMPLAHGAKAWLDLGSGGGFPALVVAILAGDSGAYVHMVESNAKKVGFLRTAVGTLHLGAEVHHARIDSASVHGIKADVITARALAPLAQLFQMSEPWISSGSIAFFHKGRDYAREIADASVAWDSELLIHTSAVDDASVILEVRSLRRR